MSDEGLHEIQLNGKQLVFLFMTATVVAVVIFLCGVMVGRGVPTQRTPVLAADGVDPTRGDTAATTASDVPATASVASGASASPSSNLGLTYPDRLEEPEPVVEELTAGPAPREAFAETAGAKAPPVKPEPVKTESAAAKKKGDTTPAKSLPAAAAASGPGFVVQVTASRQRSEADAIKGRLVRKGYPAFVTTAGSSSAPTYRVRVGTYPSKRDADTVAAKLEREEQFKPWVTR